MLLELEITESTVMHRTEEAVTSLRALHELGVQISLDDFGTGYSSLAYLHRFPVHTLKVDQSFVRDIRSDRDDAAIVSTVITLARQLNLKALAEGVETEAQLAFLRAARLRLVPGLPVLPAASRPPKSRRCCGTTARSLRRSRPRRRLAGGASSGPDSRNRRPRNQGRTGADTRPRNQGRTAGVSSFMPRARHIR